MSKRKLKKRYKILLLIVLLIFIGIGCLGYYFYPKQSHIKNIDPKKEELNYGIFDEYYDSAKEVVSNMSIEEKIGQLFLVRYYRENIDEYKNYYPGGYILFAKDFGYHDKNSIRDELSYVQSVHKYPVILGVDEEGGYVVRVSRYLRYDSFETPRYYYDQGGYELLEQTENEKAELLKDIGINLNLAPVADYSTDPNDFIYNRAFGYDIDKTSEYIKKMVSYANNNHINSCLKHFPGYGNNVDTHTGIAYDNRSYSNFLENDFKPFKAGIEEGVPSILVSHNIVECMDSNYPASLSYKVHRELRDTLRFSGIIMTDDLAMDAVAGYVSDGRAAVMAINAGNDMIITSDFISMRDQVLNAYNNGEIKEEVINEAAVRVIAWKYYSGLLSKS